MNLLTWAEKLADAHKLEKKYRCIVWHIVYGCTLAGTAYLQVKSGYLSGKLVLYLAKLVRNLSY